uniref:Uncharacterized protein n=1 Tax=Onchocerca volvulus TaxID=6282 RepID=A0A8R1TSI5_ONCVO
MKHQSRNRRGKKEERLICLSLFWLIHPWLDIWLNHLLRRTSCEINQVSPKTCRLLIKYQLSACNCFNRRIYFCFFFVAFSVVSSFSLFSFVLSIKIAFKMDSKHA